MRILIGGGGTGGHIYPALALARYAQNNCSSTEVLFVGSTGGMENKIVPSSGFRLVCIPVRGFKRNFSQLGGFIRDLLGGIARAGKIIDEFKPDVILGMGGYVSAPLTIAGVLKRKPVVIHEQNALPGTANRLLAPVVKKVCISFPQTADKLPPFSRTVYTGNPRAGDLASVDREESCRLFNLGPAEKNILIYSGSRGAQRINEVVTEYLKNGLHPADIGLIYVTGDIYYEEVIEQLGVQPDNIKIFAYLDQMPAALSAADLVITRSGATTLAEITVMGIPAILIPSPNVVNNHQYFNAKILADVGAAILIDEKELDCSRLDKEIKTFLEQPGLLQKMGEASKKAGVQDAPHRLYQCLQEVVG